VQDNFGSGFQVTKVYSDNNQHHQYSVNLPNLDRNRNEVVIMTLLFDTTLI
jgi:hypothetical protein